MRFVFAGAPGNCERQPPYKDRDSVVAPIVCAVGCIRQGLPKARAAAAAAVDAARLRLRARRLLVLVGGLAVVAVSEARARALAALAPIAPAALRNHRSRSLVWPVRPVIPIPVPAWEAPTIGACLRRRLGENLPRHVQQ